MKKRIIIANNYPLVSIGYNEVFNEHFKDHELHFVSNCNELAVNLNKRKYDLLILSITDPSETILELIKKIKLKHTSISILVNAISNNKQLAIRCIKAGALGYLCLENSIEEFINAIKSILNKKVYLTTYQTKCILSDMHNGNKKLETLSTREFEIFQLLAFGNSTKIIASKLNLQQNTISTYRKRLKTKLHISNTIELSRIALDHGLI